MKKNLAQTAAVYLMLIAGVSPVLAFGVYINHFPYGLLCVLLFNRANHASVLLVTMMGTLYLATYYFQLANAEHVGLRGLIGPFNIVAPLFFFRGNEEFIGRAARHVFWLYLVVGCMQALHLLVPLEGFMRLFISRFHGAPFNTAYRGVQMLESEPARASSQLLSLFILATSLSKGWNDRLILPLVGAQALLIKSTTGLLLTITFLAFRFVRDAVRRPRRVLVVVLGALVVVPMLDENPKTRLLIDLLQKDGLTGVHTALAASSGGRFLGMTQTLEAIAVWPFGHGFDPEFLEGEKRKSEDQSVMGYSTRISSRPVSASATFLYIFGVPLLAMLIYAVRRVAGPIRMTPEVLFVIALSFLYSSPMGSMSLLLLLAVVYSENRRRAVRERPQGGDAG